MSAKLPTREAALAVRSGEAGTVLVIGLDAPSRDISAEEIIAEEGNFPPAVSFALWARRRMHDTAMTREHLARDAAKNWNYARTNEFAARPSP